MMFFMEQIFTTPQEVTQYLIKLGYTQARISAESGIPQGTVSRIASGKHREPRLSTFQKLIRLALKVKQGGTQGVSHAKEATQNPDTCDNSTTGQSSRAVATDGREAASVHKPSAGASDHAVHRESYLAAEERQQQVTIGQQEKL